MEEFGQTKKKKGKNGRRRLLLDKITYANPKAFLVVLPVRIHLKPQQWMCDLAGCL
jgi:hypothetical protein